MAKERPISPDELADRVRTALAGRPVTEMRMFGGIAFMLNGNMLAACSKDGRLMLRVGRDAYEAAKAKPGAEPVIMRGRPVAGYVDVVPEALRDERALRGWLDIALAHVATLPAKGKTRAGRGR